MKRFFTITLLIFTLLSACNMPIRPTTMPGIDQNMAATIVAATLQALYSPTPQPAKTVSPTATPLPPQDTATPEITATVTPTVTPTYSQPVFSFSDNINCREGPGTQFKIVTLIKAGQQVTGAAVQGNYWIINNPTGPGTCWVLADYATPSGSTWTLPTMEPMDNIPAVVLPAPTWKTWNYTCTPGNESGKLVLNITLNWTDQTTGETGYKVYRGDEVIATLPADSNSYDDNTPIAIGTSMTYTVEVYLDSSTSRSSSIHISCQ